MANPDHPERSMGMVKLHLHGWRVARVLAL